MTVWSNWIPAISSSSVLAVASFSLGAFYKARVEKGIQHAFDLKLEAFRGLYRRDEEELRAEVRRSDEKISALRAGALSGMTARQEALDRRRAQAVERIWVETVELWRFKALSQMIIALKLDALMDAASGLSNDAKAAREFAATLLNTSGFTDAASLKTGNAADKERPFLDPIAWAMFSAYRLMLAYPAMQLTLIKAGIERDTLKDSTTILQPIKAALPAFEKYLDEYGVSGLPHLVQPLEDKLLAALTRSLDGKGSDEALIKQAAEIVEGVGKAAEALSNATKQAAALPEIP